MIGNTEKRLGGAYNVCSNKLSVLSSVLNNLDNEAAKNNDVSAMKREDQVLLKDKIKHVELLISESQDVIRAMRKDQQHLGTTEKRVKTDTRIKQLERMLHLRQAQFSRLLKERLLEKRSVSTDEGATELNAFFRETIERGKRTSALLAESIALLEETQEQGETVLHDLENQREEITTINHNLTSIGGYISDSRNILANMTRRAIYNKIILWLMVSTLILAILLVLNFLYLKHSTSNAPPDTNDLRYRLSTIDSVLKGSN